MAKALLMSGGVGGVSSDDVTAKREHVLQGYTALTSDSGDEPIQGTMINRGTWNTASEVVNAPWESNVHTRFEEGYYPKDGNFKPTAKIPYAMLVNVLGIDSSKILDNYSVLGKQGTIQRWICTTGDVITALGGEGFAWDDTYANRGRGIVMKILNGGFIQGANWVFLPSPNHLPHNIRKGVNINGTIGTMEDYSTGRTVFNGATFDGLLVSGVANKPFYIINDYYANYVSNEYRYSGIWGGGMNFSLTTFSPALLGRKIGCVLSQSINLSPFSRIVISYNLSGTVKNSPDINLECFVSPLRSLKRGGKVVQGVGNIDGFSEAKAAVIAGSVTINRQGQLTLDVRNINEQAFLILTASVTIANSSESFFGALQITKIEFFN